MNTAIDSVDKQLQKVEATIGTITEVYDANPSFNEYGSVPYHAAYNRYIKILATHLSVGDRGTDIAPLLLDTQTNTSDANYDEFSHSDYHIPGKHTPAERKSFTYSDLPYVHECDGPCSVEFRSPHDAFKEHRTECGTGDDIGIVSLLDIVKLRRRSVGEGCGHKYYKCPRSTRPQRCPKTQRSNLHQRLRSQRWNQRSLSGF